MMHPAAPLLVDEQEDRRFRILIGASLAGFLLMSGLLWTVEVADNHVNQVARPLAARSVEIRLEALAEPAPPDIEAQDTTLEEKPATDSAREDAPPDAREQAVGTGLAAMSRELAALAELSSSDALAANGAADAAAEAGNREPDILASAVTTDSGGIDTRGLGANAGGGMPARQTRQLGGETAPDLEPRGDSQKRTPQILQQVFEQNKSRIHMLYERARRQKPNLEGKLVLEITIEPGGEVSGVRVISSDLGHPALERRIVARVRQFTFPPSTQGAVTRRYPIEFLPS